jgi:hypothetical protein
MESVAAKQAAWIETRATVARGFALIIALLGVVGCSKPPATPVHHLAKEEQSPNPPSIQQSPDWANSAANPESSLPPQPVATPAPEIAFENPAANQAWNQYVDSFEAVRSVPPPPASEPSAIAAHIAEINRRLEILQQSRAALQNNLTSPEDKKRFRTAEQSLSESSQ